MCPATKAPRCTVPLPRDDGPCQETGLVRGRRLVQHGIMRMIFDFPLPDCKLEELKRVGTVSLTKIQSRASFARRFGAGLRFPVPEML